MLSVHFAQCGLAGHPHGLQVTAVFYGGVPRVQLDLPQFDLLVPGATAVFLELVGRPGVHSRLPQVPGPIR